MPIMPMGDRLNEAVIRKAYDFMLESNRARQIARIENVPADALPFFHGLGFHTTVKDTEYLYETAALVQLKGDRYKSKRAAYNAFVKRYPGVRVQPYRPEYFEDCLALYDAWKQSRIRRSTDAVYRAMLEDAQSAHRIGLMHDESSGLVGRVVFVEGQLKGYTFGYPLNDEVFCMIFEVADLSIKGLAPFIFREFCRELSAYRWINGMDDSGLDNLRQAKLSYRPVEQIVSYNARLPL
jgi:hypothetical protein